MIRQLKLLAEMAALLSVIPLLVFAKVNYPGTGATGCGKEAVNRQKIKTEPAYSTEDYGSVLPGLLSSKLIIVNY